MPTLTRATSISMNQGGGGGGADQAGKLDNAPSWCSNQPIEVKTSESKYGDSDTVLVGGEIDPVSTAFCYCQSIVHPIYKTNDKVDNCVCPEGKLESAEADKLLSRQKLNRGGGGYCVHPNCASNGDADMRKYLEGSGLDVESDFLLRNATTQLDLDADLQLREYTLRQWIKSSNPGSTGFHSATSLKSSGDGVANYTKSALLIALKFTECILEAEKDESNGYGNPIPLASIASENVLIRARKGQHEDSEEMIEFVWVMSFVGDDSATGTVMERLLAVGNVFYELFAMTPKEHIATDHDIKTTSIDSINIGNESETQSNTCQHKKMHRWSNHADDSYSEYVSKLESNGVPWSLCALVTNLLECRHGSFCEDDAYASFADLQVDLKLMLDNSACFLDNIQYCSVPKLVLQDKIYGREEELLMLDELFKHHMGGRELNGTIISGEAGVGKSKLAIHLQKLTDQFSGYCVYGKFEHNLNSLKPLSTIVNMFDSLCELLLKNSSHLELKKIDEELTSALGSQPNHFGVIPSLRKLLPSCLGAETTSKSCVDSAISMRYLMGELLRVMSSISKPITIVIDDIQFADHASLLLVRYLLFSAQSSPIFFALCHRDEEISMSVPFNAWLISIEMLALKPIKLEPLTTFGANNLISEALHLSPRLTFPLSSVLHRKTRGNPLFLKQLLDSLTEQGYIYIDLKQHRWAWDLDRVIELEISDSVLALLMSDIQRLPSDLQFGLQVAACIGPYITESMLNYLSIDLGLDLKDILQQVSRKGFMIETPSSKTFRFAHDKIQQAAYEMMPDQQRRENHMRYGLAMCTHTLTNVIEDDVLFFAAVNQINQGGPVAVHEPSQMTVFAELNLKAGMRSIDLCDYNNAFTLFQYGRTFLGDDNWTLHYQLSLDIHDSLADAALVLNKLSVVTSCSDEVALHARCFEDKVRCLCNVAHALGAARRYKQSIESFFEILLLFGETLPRSSGEKKLRTGLYQIIRFLLSTSDDSIYGMTECSNKNIATLINVYVGLAHVLHYEQPWQVGSVSLRMVELTLKTGLSAKSSLAFAHFGGVLVVEGFVGEGCRLGKLALRLVEKKGSLQYKSSVICFVYDRILWAIEPLQSIVEAHLLGRKTGQQSGDFVYGFYNQQLAIVTNYVAGQSLDIIQKMILDFISSLQSHGVDMFLQITTLLLSHITALKDEMPISATSVLHNMPSEDEILTDANSGPSALAHGKLLHLTRAFLFRRVSDASSNIDISGPVDKSYHQLNPQFLMGYFFEGLTSFLLARRSSGNASTNWIVKGHSILTRMRSWNGYSKWNWENKMMLLEAECMYTKGEFDKAELLFDSAIRSAHEHKFIHEEAIASELAGMFYQEIGNHQKSYLYLAHSHKCYEKWGAQAVARRVGLVIRNRFGPDICQLETGAVASLEHLFASSQGKKRQDGE